jgi:hypothetical protein
VAFDVIPATPFGVAVVGVAPTVSGPGAAALAAGVGSILVSLAVGCFGVWGADAGWGPRVAGAFAILAVLAGLAASILGRAGLRQIRRSPATARVAGRGLALGGLVCGLAGVALAALSLVFAFSLALT